MKKRLKRSDVPLRRMTLHVSRWTLYVSAVLGALLAIVFIVARIMLPMIEERKSDLEQYLSNRSGQVVKIESLSPYWDGLHPGAAVTGLQVFAKDSAAPIIRLSEVRISLSLLPMLWGELEINSLLIVKPSFALERLADGQFRVSGFDPLRTEQIPKGENFFAWLFRQNRLEIANGELQWIDQQETGAVVALSNVNLRLKNRGERHRLFFSAEFPTGMCLDCSLVLDITGNPLASPLWNGDMHLRATEVNIDALPLIVREKLPRSFSGNFSVQLWSDWEQGLPTLIRGHVSAADMSLPVPGRPAPLLIPTASGDLKWRTRQDGWRLDIANPVIGLTGPAWAAEHLRIERQPEESRIQVIHVDLGDVTAFAAKIRNELQESVDDSSTSSKTWIDYWLVAKPNGAIKYFDLRLEGDPASPRDFTLETDILHASTQPYRNFPGVSGLSGHLSMMRETGRFRIDSNNVTASLPRVFREPLSAQHASGDVSWEKLEDHWSINGDDLRVTSDDIRGTGKMHIRVPLEHSVSPYLDLRVDFRDGNGSRAAHYYPAPRLSPATLAWMESSFLAGRITEGHLIYDGPVRDFPFREKNGNFEIRGHVRQGVYRYLPGWEPVKQADVDVVVKGSETLVTGVGKIGDLDATRIVVHSRNTSEGHHIVSVSGNVSGPLNETLNVLRDIKPEPGASRWLSFIPSGLEGKGDGILSLDITIPMNDHATRINGEYRFLRNALLFPESGVSAEAIEGRVNFTEEGIREGGLSAQLLGGPTVLAVGREKNQLRIHGQGTITAQGLAPVVGPKIAPRLAGDINWDATWWWKKEKETGVLRGQAELKDFKIALPPPLDAPAGLSKEKLIVRTESSTGQNIRLDLRVGNKMNGKLVLGRERGVWRLAGGRIGFGEEFVPVPIDQGLHVSARLSELDIDKWWPWLGGTSTGMTENLKRVSTEIRSLRAFDRNFEGISLDLFRSQEVWSGTVNGTFIAGNVKYFGKGSSARFDLDLARLVLPDKRDVGQDTMTDPRRLPTVELRSKSFGFREKDMGELDFMAESGDSGWLIKRFNLTRPEMKLTANGKWQFVSNQHTSEFDIVFKSTNMGKTMAAFGVPDQAARGEVTVKSHLSWPGLPAEPQLANLNGNIEVLANKGRFLQVKQGAGGRLFGLLDLSAINRYLTLDFSPVFGRGFIYDKIEGKVSIEKGNAYSDNFTIRGPATKIDVRGRIGLTAEDFDLAIELQPKLSDGLTLASWGVWGPQVAAAVLAVQRIFKKQISAGTRITYVVKGPWGTPEITKLIKGEEGINSDVPENPVNEHVDQ